MEQCLKVFEAPLLPVSLVCIRASSKFPFFFKLWELCVGIKRYLFVLSLEMEKKLEQTQRHTLCAMSPYGIAGLSTEPSSSLV